MPQLGKMEFYVFDRNGNALSGVSVEVRKQGATAIGPTGPNTVSVNNPGAIIVGDDVRAGLTGSTRTIDTVTATTIVNSGLGWGTVADDVRMTATSGLPALYEDAEGAESKSNPLTTDADGFAYAWADNNLYDARVSGGGAIERLLVDIPALGGGRWVSNIFGSGTVTAFEYDTLRTLVAGDNLARWRHAGAEKVKFDLNGRGTFADGLRVTANGIVVTAGGGTITAGGLAINGGGLTLGASGGVIVSSQTTGTHTLAANLTTTKDIDLRRLLSGQGTAVTGSDITITAGWGSTASKTVSAYSRDTRGTIQITANGSGIAANPEFVLTYKDGAFSGTRTVAMIARGDIASPANATVSVLGASTTVLDVMFVGTPVAGNTYIFDWLVVG